MVKFWHRKYVISASAFFTYVELRIFNRIKHFSKNVVSFWEFFENFGTKIIFNLLNLTLSGLPTLTGGIADLSACEAPDNVKILFFAARHKWPR
jgi:hypothetical protein